MADKLILLSRSIETFCDTFHVDIIVLVLYGLGTLIGLFLLRKDIF